MQSSSVGLTGNGVLGSGGGCVSDRRGGDISLATGAALVSFAACLGLALLVFDVRVVATASVVLGLAALTVRFPFAGVVSYLLIAGLHLEELGFSPVVLRIQLLLALTCLIALALPGVARREWKRWNWLGTDWPLVLLFAAACASVPLSVSRPGAAAACWQFAKLGFGYVLIRQTATTPRRLRAIVWVILWMTALTALLALYGAWNGRVYVGEHGLSRMTGLTSTSGDPNTLANTLIAGLPLMLLLATVEPKLRSRATLYGMAAFSLYVMLHTGARAGLVSLLACCALIVLVSRRKLLASLTLASMVLLFWAGLPTELKERYASLGAYRSEATYVSRRESARLGFRMLADHPLTGVGLGCYMIARVEEYDGIWLQPHNLYAQVAGELGLVGMIAFAGFLLVSLRTCWRARRLLSESDFGAKERIWLDRLCVSIPIMFAALLVQGLAGHNFGRWHYYAGAALATSCLQVVLASVESERRERAAPGGRE